MSRIPELVRATRDAGAWQCPTLGTSIYTGTDSNSFGFSLHRELEELVAVGLTARDALQTATINPARFAGLEKEVGRVATGYAADLILLDANPLQDIRNTSAINAVILRGQLLDRAALDAVLAKAKSAGRPGIP
jgi:imidazolonepropionase-like amidohydrolase